MIHASRRLLLFVLVLATVSVPRAATAGESIGLSHDGTSWSTGLEKPLFEPDRLWVPGDVDTSSFSVRNEGPTRALLLLSVIDLVGDEVLREDVTLRARVAGGTWVTVHSGSPSHPLSRQAIARGGVTRVEVQAVFDPASGNASQAQNLRLSLRITLFDAGAGDGGSGTPPGAGAPGGEGAGSTGDRAPGGGWLPATGSVLATWWIWAAALAIGTGLALSRARREDTKHV